ncbi:DUF4350 domain-containing protein [uncultured Serinicoccus sp.]|uniref:DUF4350 domain-containing protein n=1 Tax=uncultured Serinicoccus sp. TaxID=735514 RepID=UPI0026229471|nr:DUF4350 domain-containing protein [uncultured Serinicoccus sp.]
MRAVRRWAPWVLLVLVAAVLAALLSTPRSGEPLSPVNNGPDGAQALAEVLRQEGVDVEIVAGTTGLDPPSLGPGTTVLLPHTRYLGPETGPDLVAGLADLDQLVVLADGTGGVGASLGLDVEESWGAGIPVAADCSVPWAREGDQLVGWDVLLAAGSQDRPATTACFPPGEGHNLGGAREGAVLVLEQDGSRPRTVVAGIGPTWTNARITEGANAAVALRLLGGSDRLVWVQPQPSDLGLEAAGSLWDVLPSTLTPALWVVGGGVLALALWRGRRLGAVVTEPLPAVVRSTETTVSRARLYHQAHDSRHAARAVQSGARRRLAPLLGLPTTTGADRLAEVVSRVSGRPLDQVRHLLLEPGAAGDDAGLLVLVREIHALEDELRRRDRPVATDPTDYPDHGGSAPAAQRPGTSDSTAERTR